MLLDYYSVLSALLPVCFLPAQELLQSTNVCFICPFRQTEIGTDCLPF